MGTDRPSRRPEGGTGLIELRPIDGVDPAIGPLLDSAACEGHLFVRRLIDDWQTGANRFDRAGEVFLGAFLDGNLAGIGGLNRDPYAADGGTGRLRHVYVSPNARRSGVGRRLVLRLISYGRDTFQVLRLRTVTPEGAAFYAALGFGESDESDATHRIALGRERLAGRRCDRWATEAQACCTAAMSRLSRRAASR